MWRPQERIRFEAALGRVPSAEEAAASLLFSSVEVGPVALAQRTWVPAMVPWRATDDGYVTDDVIAWYERFARGEPGAIVVEATGIRDVPSGRCCASAMTGFCRDCTGSPRRCARRAMAVRGSSSN